MIKIEVNKIYRTNNYSTVIITENLSLLWFGERFRGLIINTNNKESFLIYDEYGETYNKNLNITKEITKNEYNNYIEYFL